VANYNVDIAVAIKGAEKLRAFDNSIKSLSKNIENANFFIRTFAKNNDGLVRSVGNLQQNLNSAGSNLRNVALGTKEATIAAAQFLKAQEELNKGLVEQQKLLDDVSGATARKSAADNKKLQEGLLKLETKQTRKLEQRFEIQQQFQEEFKNQINDINKRRQEENKLLQKNVQQTKKSVAEEIKKKFSIMASQKVRRANFKQSVREFELENRINNVLQKRKQLQARRATNQRAASNALIGGAFPLLFGQGLGASVGGAAGGFVGGKKGGQFGFAFSLVGTALGSQFDVLAQKARELGEALRDPIKNLDLLTKAIGASNTPFGDTIATLKSLGLEGIAAEAVLNKFNKTFGTNKKSLAELGEESIRFTNELAKLGTSITLFIAGPLSKFLETINDTLGNTTIKGVRRESKIEARNLAMQKFGINNFEAKKNVDIFSFALSKIRGEKKIDGQTFEEFAKSIEPEIFNRRMNEQGLGGQGGSKDFGNENLQRLIKERRDFELSNMKSQLMIEKQSMTIRSEDLDVLKKRMDLLKIVEKIKVKELVNTKIITTEQLNQHNFELEKLDVERQISEELLRQSIIMSDPMKAAMIDLQKEMTKLNDMRFQTVEFAKAVGNSFETSFKGIINGTMSVQDAFRNMLNSIANHFINTAAKMAANQLQQGLLGILGNAFGSAFSFGSSFKNFGSTSVGTAGQFVGKSSAIGFADGGRPPVGRASIVGERGPELFVPDRAGTIIPNNQLGGGTSIVVNVDASGSSVSGNTPDAQQLGNLIGAAIQERLIKEKRSGGLLSR